MLFACEMIDRSCQEPEDQDPDAAQDAASKSTATAGSAPATRNKGAAIMMRKPRH